MSAIFKSGRSSARMARPSCAKERNPSCRSLDSASSTGKKLRDLAPTPDVLPTTTLVRCGEKLHRVSHGYLSTYIISLNVRIFVDLVHQRRHGAP